MLYENQFVLLKYAFIDVSAQVGFESEDSGRLERFAERGAAPHNFNPGCSNPNPRALLELAPDFLQPRVARFCDDIAPLVRGSAHDGQESVLHHIFGLVLQACHPLRMHEPLEVITPVIQTV